MSLIVVWLHIAGVVVWIGGLVSQAVVVLPAARAGRAAPLLEVARRARPVTWTGVSVVVLTGFYNVTQLGPLAEVIESGAALRLAGKFILVIAAVALAGQRDFNQLGRASALVAAGRDPAPALRAMAWLDGIVLVLAAVVMYLGLSLARR